MPYAHLRPSGAQNDETVVQISDPLDLAIVVWILSWISKFTPNTGANSASYICTVNL